MAIIRGVVPTDLEHADGGFVLASRGIVDGSPTDFDFTVDGVRYMGRHTGLLAYQKGEPVVGTPGFELNMENVPEGGK